MNREMIAQRRDELKAALATQQAILNQAQANVNANQGALQDCDYWEAKIAEEEKEQARQAEIRRLREQAIAEAIANGAAEETECR